MQQLSGHDASFLYLETPNAHMGGAGMLIYDPSTAPGGRVTFKGILANIERRLHLARSFRQKLVRVPMDLDHPYWIEDPNFDLEYHVRHIALPKPGDWRQLCIQAARLLARPLDLSKPLWEFYVVEGLDNVEGVPEGSYAIVFKMHHAAIDGVSGMEMITAIHDLTPDADPPQPDKEWRPEREPSAWDLLARAWWNNLTRPARLPQVVVRTLPGLGRLQTRLLLEQLRGDGAPAAQNVPRTRFNGAVSAHRVVEGRRFDLGEVKRIKATVPRATVNDVVLTIVGGALRTYLSSKGELPSEPLLAMVPVSVRSEEEKGTAGNKVSAMTASLGTHIADPRERLGAVRQSTAQSKALSNAVGARTLTEYSQFLPGGLVGVAARLASETEVANRTNFFYNTVVTNIPGPQVPLYSCGARLVAMYPLGMVHDGMGLMHVVTSYCGDVVITITADRDMLPDPAFYAECLQNSYEELAKATQR